MALYRLMSTILGKVKRVAPADWWGLNVAYLHLVWAGWRLFVRKEKLDRWVVDGPRFRDRKPLTPEERRDVLGRARLVSAAARFPMPWARCLQQSLALCLWLTRQGLQPELKIGVRRMGTDFEAHAWVEYCGEVLNAGQDVSKAFAPLTDASTRIPENCWVATRHEQI